MLFELVLLAGTCRGPACLERPLLERRVIKSVVVRVEKTVTRERKVRRTIHGR